MTIVDIHPLTIEFDKFETIQSYLSEKVRVNGEFAALSLSIMKREQL